MKGRVLLIVAAVDSHVSSTGKNLARGSRTSLGPKRKNITTTLRTCENNAIVVDIHTWYVP